MAESGLEPAALQPADGAEGQGKPSSPQEATQDATVSASQGPDDADKKEVNRDRALLQQQKASDLKDQANKKFAAMEYSEAIEDYEAALAALPELPELPSLELEDSESEREEEDPEMPEQQDAQQAQELQQARQDRQRKKLVRHLQSWWDGLSPEKQGLLQLGAQIYSNLGACHFMKKEWEMVVQATTNAVDLQPHYIRAIARRATANRHLERYDQAIADAKLVLEYDPQNRDAWQMLRELPALQQEQNEKMKAEMLGKLKDLGNGLLGKFGLSLDNFKAVQDPESGSYSVSFQQ